MLAKEIPQSKRNLQLEGFKKPSNSLISLNCSTFHYLLLKFISNIKGLVLKRPRDCKRRKLRYGMLHIWTACIRKEFSHFQNGNHNPYASSHVEMRGDWQHPETVNHKANVNRPLRSSGPTVSMLNASQPCSLTCHTLLTNLSKHARDTTLSGPTSPTCVITDTWVVLELHARQLPYFSAAERLNMYTGFL